MTDWHRVTLGRRFRFALSAILIALLIAPFFAAPAGAQYGGISGLFVTTSPDRPGFADFTGLGCSGNQEVILYWPGLAPTANDPVGSQAVPGRILAITTSISSPDPLLNGTFSFPNVALPDVEPGVYEVHARCGGLDLRVLIQIDDNGLILLSPDPAAPIINPSPTTRNVPSVLPFTGRDSDRVVSLAIGVVAMGAMLIALGRRQQTIRPEPGA